ncbi:MAG TPA: hypothetical protein VK597_10895 [Inquilinus sp.]|nr:hypothetical protein [Inquilinus sp.]
MAEVADNPALNRYEMVVARNWAIANVSCLTRMHQGGYLNESSASRILIGRKFY